MKPALGPVSTQLEADLRAAVAKGFLVWLDPQNQFTPFVDALAELRREGRLPYDVHAFRGSHLELMLTLEKAAGGIKPPPFVVHLPGFNETSIRNTPLLELYRAGKRYQKALDTLLTEAAAGKARPEQLAAFREEGALSLETADAWLADLLADDGLGLAAQLRALRPSGLLEDLLGGGPATRQMTARGEYPAVWQYFERTLGLSPAWRDDLRDLAPSPADIAFNAASWALCAEYVDDLKRAPVDPRLQPFTGLAKPLVAACREVATLLRDRQPEFYRRTADETEARLAEEVDVARAADLGKIDTLRFEEEKVLQGALAALFESDWDTALDWAKARHEGVSFWVRQDPSRASAWLLVQKAAELGRAIGKAGPSLDSRKSLDTAVERYVAHGAEVDRAHRQLEQQRAALLYPQLPEFEVLRDRLDELRRRWRGWADLWARDWSALCRAQGFLPSGPLQQRFVFDQVVRPLALESGATALFLVDSLRFEMGLELYDALKNTPATLVKLEARLAELPTLSAVGMNVLAPVAGPDGRLRPVFEGAAVAGFSTGEFQVKDPESRKRAMCERVGGQSCPWLGLDQVLGRDAAGLKNTVARARLLVVHSLEIDNAGEKGLGPAVFEQVLQQLRAAWRLLREAGVRRFVFTADHGFLLLDETTGKVQCHGRKIDPKRRHVFSPLAADHAGEARVALADLGYEKAPGYLMFPDSTAIFDSGKRQSSFVHGGNSPQERVIPVLSLVHRAAAGASALIYAVAAAARGEVAGMSSIEAKVEVVAQDALDFGGAREVALALRTPESTEIQIELCQTRGSARIQGGLILAKVGAPFEVFFRLLGAGDARLLVEIHHPTAEVDLRPQQLESRFPVSALRSARPSPPTAAVSAEEPAESLAEGSRPPAGTAQPASDVRSVAVGNSWLDELPSAEMRTVFAHLAQHGAVTEAEATAMLGGPRALRHFSRAFEELAKKAPFVIRIDVVAGVKRYVREGAAKAT